VPGIRRADGIYNRSSRPKEGFIMLIGIRRILFPTDFSETARQAQQYAMALTERFGAELHLLHIVPEITMPLPDSATSWTQPEADLSLQVEAAQGCLVKELSEKWAADHRTKHTAVAGFAVDEIVKYAKEYKIDLIVVGTHGHTGLSHLLLGSVAEKIVRLATCPVLTVHPKGHQFLTDITTESAADTPS
jgi:universal stress protein A